jgi:histone deacetylase 1/2
MGGEQIHTTNGLGMDIENVGHVIYHTPHRNIFLNNVLHVLHTKKILVSVHKLAHDNNVCLEFHPNLFFIKDRATRRTLLEGTCKGGLYPLPAAALTNKQVVDASGGSSLPMETWHHRLEQVINRNKLSCSFESKIG